MYKIGNSVIRTFQKVDRGFNGPYAKADDKQLTEKIASVFHDRYITISL